MNINEKCQRLHVLFNNMKQLNFTTEDINNLNYNNGIYIVFEKGEEMHGLNRIVRIGTHREINNLKTRLNQHRQNSGASVFRRKIGCAIINKNNPNDIDLEHWYNKDYQLIDKEKLQSIRTFVTQHITQNMSFVSFEVNRTSKEERGTLFWEAKIISTIANCPFCLPSNNWLGCYLPEQYGNFPLAKKIGLWLTKETDSPILTETELFELEKMLEQSDKCI